MAVTQYSARHPKALTYRIRCIPPEGDEEDVRTLLKSLLEVQELFIDSLASDVNGRNEKVATVRGLKPISDEYKILENEWHVPPSEAWLAGIRNRVNRLRHVPVDSHFLGFTSLHDPDPDTPNIVDCIAISGLGSHGFGSWKDRNSQHMWLRDALPGETKHARVLIYGYDSKVAGSDTFQNLDDVATYFRKSLQLLIKHTRPRRPIIFLGHSLGGLVVKEAISQMANGNEDDQLDLQSVYGLMLFGVPNHGMDIRSLLPMVKDQLNVSFLQILNKDGGLLDRLIQDFNKNFRFRDSRIESFFETVASPTAEYVNGKWSMTGPKTVLVDRNSAKSNRPWEHDANTPIKRSHSDMIKFSYRDADCDVVLDILKQFVSKAPAIIARRFEESPTPTAWHRPLKNVILALGRFLRMQKILREESEQVRMLKQLSGGHLSLGVLSRGAEGLRREVIFRRRSLEGNVGVKDSRRRLSFTEPLPTKTRPSASDSYDHVEALLVTSEIPDIFHPVQATKLKAVFEQNYGFNTVLTRQTTELQSARKDSKPSSESTFRDKFGSAVTTLLRRCNITSTRALGIIFYSGPAVWLNDSRLGDGEGELMLNCFSDMPDAARKDLLSWNVIDEIIRESQTSSIDILLILDCDGAGNLHELYEREYNRVRTRYTQSHPPRNRNYEILAATGPHSQPRNVGQNTFTTTLISALTELALESTSFSTSFLCQRIAGLHAKSIPFLFNRFRKDYHIRLAKCDNRSRSEPLERQDISH